MAYSSTQTVAMLAGWVIVVVSVGMTDVVFSEVAEVCIGEDSRISCSNNDVIVMTSAEYGHMSLGRCLVKEDQYLGCSNDVMSTFDRWCSGRKTCDFGIPNDELEEMNNNCLHFLTKYLKLDYACLSVEANCNDHQPTKLKSTSGKLASHVTDIKGCGSSGSPWIISANPGQTIQLDLVDFAASSQTSNLVSCRSVYGFILERALGINHTICGGPHREGALYTSKTNFIEIQLSSRSTRGDAHFIIKYEVAGCSEIQRPENAWYKREGNEAVIGCENNDQEWRLTCTGNTWQGQVGNCSTTVIVAAPKVPRNNGFNLHSVVIMAGIIGGAVVCSVVAIVIGVVFVKKYRMHQETKRVGLQTTYATMDRNVQAYYRPVTLDQSANIGTGWDMPLPPDPHDQMMSYPDPCTCATLQMRNHGESDNTIGGASLERQSLYNAIKST